MVGAMVLSFFILDVPCGAAMRGAQRFGGVHEVER
jgi:hypothetical protein